MCLYVCVCVYVCRWGLRPWFCMLEASHARMRAAMRAYHAHLLRTAWRALRGEVTARQWKRAALQAARVGALWQAAQVGVGAKLC